MKFPLLFILLSVTFFNAGGQVLPYKNPQLPVEQRVKDLLGRMTPEEKFWQLFMIPGDMDNATEGQYKNGLFGFQVGAVSQAAGDGAEQLISYNISKEDARSLAQKINAIQKYFVEETRLGIPLIFFDEALHGLMREGATVFPQAIGLAASFDTALMRDVSNAIADETLQRGIRQILTPVVNLATDVRWGRTEETYGEDPFLSARMGVVFVSSFEKKNIITTPKHFIANVGDGGRDSYPIHLNKSYLEQTHLIPFEACFKEGGSRSVMTAYNSLDGEACTANEWLLTEKLKGEYHFNGFVISDAGATGGSFVLHKTSTNYPESGKDAVSAGLDVIFQTDFSHYQLFIQPFLDGSIDPKRIDDAVSRVLRAKFELGLFEHPYVSQAEYEKTPDHRQIAKEAALKSFVLLKNKNNVLPLPTSVKKLALIGTDAGEARLGGYSGPGSNKVSILDGLKQKLKGQTQIMYAAGTGRHDDVWEVIPAGRLFHAEKGTLKPGLEFKVFDNIRLTGNPVETGTDGVVDKLWTLSRPGSHLTTDFYSVVWDGILVPDSSGKFRIGVNANDGFRLYINDELLIDKWKKESFLTLLREYQFEKDKQYRIRLEYFEPVGNGKIQLIWEKGDDRMKRIAEAVKIAEEADAVVVVAGIEEGEFRDRGLLNLPGKQELLIHEIEKTGKPLVVVLIGGSAITMNNWINDAGAILMAWYPGQEGGHAVADVLFGDDNPAGRLPVTFPVHEGQLPLVYNHLPTGRGDDYLNLTGKPLFPFGYGLSYTTFEYSGMHLSKGKIRANEITQVNFTLKNTGNCAGEEVPQLYIHDEFSSVAQPVMALKGFQRIRLKPGESKQVSFQITPDLLKLFNKNNEWVVEPGDFRIMIGASSADIKLNTILTVE